MENVLVLLYSVGLLGWAEQRWAETSRQRDDSGSFCAEWNKDKVMHLLRIDGSGGIGLRQLRGFGLERHA